MPRNAFSLYIYFLHCARRLEQVAWEIESFEKEFLALYISEADIMSRGEVAFFIIVMSKWVGKGDECVKYDSW